MAKLPSGSRRATSFVTSRSSQTNGASITKVLSGDKDNVTEGKGW